MFYTSSSKLRIWSVSPIAEGEEQEAPAHLFWCR